MVEKLDVAFYACDANSEGAMVHGCPHLRERNTQGNAVIAYWFRLNLVIRREARYDVAVVYANFELTRPESIDVPFILFAGDHSLQVCESRW
jgi:hypothetical protein